jgi:hypothetical protein
VHRAVFGSGTNFVNGDGSSLRAVFPCLDKALAKQVRRVDGMARISARTRANSAFPRSDCGMLSRAHSCYRRRIVNTGPRFTKFVPEPAIWLVHLSARCFSMDAAWAIAASGESAPRNAACHIPAVRGDA